MQLRMSKAHRYLSKVHWCTDDRWYEVIHLVETNGTTDYWCIKPENNRGYLVTGDCVAEVRGNLGTINMNKQAALARLDALEKEAAALREIISKPDALLPAELQGQVVFGGGFVSAPELDGYLGAFATMIKLRQQPGSQPPSNERQFLIGVDFKAGGMLINTTPRTPHNGSKFGKISPCFATMEQAIAAVRVVGDEAILQMFRTLAHSDQGEKYVNRN